MGYIVKSGGKSLGSNPINLKDSNRDRSSVQGLGL